MTGTFISYDRTFVSSHVFPLVNTLTHKRTLRVLSRFLFVSFAFFVRVCIVGLYAYSIGISTSVRALHVCMTMQTSGCLGHPFGEVIVTVQKGVEVFDG
jgi:hypothetical protein